MAAYMEFALFVFLICVLQEASAVTKTIPAVSGSSVKFDCEITNAGKLAWDKTDRSVIAIDSSFIGNYMNSSRFSLNTGVDGKQTLSIAAVDIQDDGTYRCYGLADTTQKDVFVLKLLVHPSSTSVSSLPDQIQEGSRQVLACNVDGAKPPPGIQWILTGPYTNRTELKGVEDVLLKSDSTWRKRSNLTFSVTREMYKATITCITSISYFYNETNEIPLDVNLAPLTPTMEYFTGLFDDNTVQTISCESEGSRPSAVLDFYLDGAVLDNVRREVYPKNDGTYTAISRISLKFTRQMDGSKFSCNATNSVVKTQGMTVSKSVVLLATYAPKIISDNGTREVIEKRNVVLTCLIDARPMPIPENIFWRRNGEIVSGRRFNISKGRNSDLVIESVSRNDIGNYVCTAGNRVGFTSSQSLYLDVQYSPVCTRSDVLRLAAKLGASVKLLCHVEGNPGTLTITWRYKTRNVIIKADAVGTQVNGRPREVTSVIYVSVTSPLQYTDIECRATNAIGVSSKPCLFQITQPGPLEVPRNCSSSTLSESKIKVHCIPGFDRDLDQFYLLQTFASSAYQTVDNSTMADFVVDGLLSGRVYTFRVCASSNQFSLMSCSDSITAETDSDPSTSAQVASAGNAESVPYVLGGVFCFLALTILVAVGIYCFRKKQKESDDVRTAFNKNNFPRNGARNSGCIRYIKPKNIDTRETRLHDTTHLSREHQSANHTSTQNVNKRIETGLSERKNNKDDLYKQHSYVNLASLQKRDCNVQGSSAPSKTEIQLYREGCLKLLTDNSSHKKTLEPSTISSLRSPHTKRRDLCYSETDIYVASNVGDTNNSLRFQRSLSLKDTYIDQQTKGKIRLRCRVTSRAPNIGDNRNKDVDDTDNSPGFLNLTDQDVCDSFENSRKNDANSYLENKQNLISAPERISWINSKNIDIHDITVLRDRPRRISYNFAMNEDDDQCAIEFLRASAMALDQLDRVLNDSESSRERKLSTSSSSSTDSNSGDSHDFSFSEDNNEGSNSSVHSKDIQTFDKVSLTSNSLSSDTENTVLDVEKESSKDTRNQDTSKNCIGNYMDSLVPENKVTYPGEKGSTDYNKQVTVEIHNHNHFSNEHQPSCNIISDVAAYF